MPRVVPDQRSKFENEEFFRKLSRECEIKYTGFRDRPHEERQARFQNACRDGRSEIAFVATGTNLSLQFFPASWQGEQRQAPTREYVDFERETGKVYLKAPMILNGVCVIWKGWIDMQRLDGMGCLEFDDERAQSIPVCELLVLMGILLCVPPLSWIYSRRMHWRNKRLRRLGEGTVNLRTETGLIVRKWSISLDTGKKTRP
uniref:Core-binding factor subunit beta n=2 Tax=Geotrypetes seraphini TaxID=260995 RepID=A0A6P8QIR5_GEOSA|nr:core-binding factor subunit beta isoform X6 [Geotrypetes seraphini]